MIFVTVTWQSILIHPISFPQDFFIWDPTSPSRAMENRTFVFPVSASDNILIDFGAKIMYIICTHQEGFNSRQPSRPGHGGQECAKAEK
jgi:hypothetical protein